MQAKQGALLWVGYYNTHFSPKSTQFFVHSSHVCSLVLFMSAISNFLFLMFIHVFSKSLSMMVQNSA